MATVHFVFKRNGVTFKEEDKEASDVPEMQRTVITAQGPVQVTKIVFDGSQVEGGPLLGGFTEYYSADGTLLRGESMSAAPPPPPAQDAQGQPAPWTETGRMACPVCRGTNPVQAMHCMWCGASLKTEPVQRLSLPPRVTIIERSGPDLRRIVGITGAVVMAFGTFLPFVSVPLAGSISYFNNGQGDGIIILGLAAIALLICLASRYRSLVLVSIIALIVLGYDFWNMQQRIAGLDRSDSFSAALAQSVQIQYGWFVMVAGAIALAVTSFLKVPGAEAPVRR